MGFWYATSNQLLVAYNRNGKLLVTYAPRCLYKTSYYWCTLFWYATWWLAKRCAPEIHVRVTQSPLKRTPSRSRVLSPSHSPHSPPMPPEPPFPSLATPPPALLPCQRRIPVLLILENISWWQQFYSSNMPLVMNPSKRSFPHKGESRIYIDQRWWFSFLDSSSNLQ
jgi:hypothetical protein